MSAGHQNGRMDDRDVNKNGNGNKGCGKTGLHLEQYRLLGKLRNMTG